MCMWKFVCNRLKVRLCVCNAAWSHENSANVRPLFTAGTLGLPLTTRCPNSEDPADEGVKAKHLRCEHESGLNIIKRLHFKNDFKIITFNACRKMQKYHHC